MALPGLRTMDTLTRSEARAKIQEPAVQVRHQPHDVRRVPLFLSKRGFVKSWPLCSKEIRLV